MHASRHYSLVDRLCLGLDQAVRSLLCETRTTDRAYPAQAIAEPALTEEQKKQSAALMRVNHAGEVCAQALYHGQGLVSQSPQVREKMQQAALEEGDHLAWCQQRLDELHSHPSYLNPLWYSGSFLIGMVAGMVGDTWSLGFLAETEQQVVKHLETHLHLLPAEDKKSVAVLQKMQMDEEMHRDEAMHLGGRVLPLMIKQVMALMSKVMVKVAYWV